MAKKIKMNEKVEAMTFAQCMDKWYRHCKVNNYAEKTITYYENTIHVFNKFFDETRLAETIDEDTLQDYILYLKDSGVKDTTIKTYIGGLRTVLYFFMDNGWVDYFRIKVPKCAKQIKDIYTDEELRALLKKPNLNKCSFAEYRNWVMVNYLFGTGQRETSIVNIRIKDLDLANGIVKLTATKNKKQTLLPLSDSLIAILEQYLNYRKGEAEDFLFCNVTGEQLSTSGMISAIKLYNRSRGVSKTSIHLFRHTFATKWVRQNGDIVKLQHILCHSDLKTTQKYLNVCLGDLQQDYQQMNPLESMLCSKKHMKL